MTLAPLEFCRTPSLQVTNIETKSFSRTPYSTRIDSPGLSLTGPTVSPSTQPLDSLRPMSDLAVVFHPEGSFAAEVAEMAWLLSVSIVPVYGTT